MNRRPIEFIQACAILVANLPLAIFTFWLCIQQHYSPYFIAIFFLLQFILVFYSIYLTRQEFIGRLRSLTSVVEGMLQGDFSLKARSELSSSELRALVDSITTLSNELSTHKIANAEKRALLEKIITQIDIGVITADEAGNIAAMNSAAIAMLNIQQPALVDNIRQLNVVLPEHPAKELVEMKLGEEVKKLYVQVDTFREFGSRQTLILITDMNHLLRQEELKSWESLVRVISHEINNSLAPIASLSGSVIAIVKNSDFNNVALAQEAYADIITSAQIISDRAHSLAEFIAQYRSLSHIGQPKREGISVRTLVNPLLPLFISQRIVLEGDADLVCSLDSAQIKQVIINLLKNASEAMQHPDAGDVSAPIVIAVERAQSDKKQVLRIDIIDSGCGIRHHQNLFIPFYTTKAQGAGIGLALSRQIIESHQGSLQIFNRASAKGCCARIELPMDSSCRLN